MKLKQLEITGFKSFVDRTAIGFPPGICAIVGPNGCGKSNIIDALRWVMGEQSVKQLRGKAMEDIIFAGADGKPPVNMAEVSLTLANDNGSMPEELKDFSEVMITRRLYRSGESGYYLNKRPCRLKDINNLFCGSGMGPRTYAIIQQGNIGAITDASTEERRYFLEDAAGVTRYKNRKNEALRKIGETNQNLLRVDDIILEVNRQMGSLNRQVNKAKRFHVIKDRIRELDICLNIHYYTDYSHQIDQTADVLKGLKDENIAHSAQIKKLDAQVEEIKLARIQKNEKIAKIKNRKFEKQREIDKIENDLKHLKNNVSSLGHEAHALENSRSDLVSQIEKMKGEVAQVEQDHERLTKDHQSAKSHLEDELKSVQDINDQILRLNKTLEVEKKTLADKTTLETRYQSIYQNAATTKESVNRRLKQVKEEELKSENKLSLLIQDETLATQVLDECRQVLADLNQMIEQITVDLQEKKQALSQQVKKVQSLDIERNKVRSQYNALKKMETNFEWYKEGVQAIMKRVEPETEAPDDSPKSAILGLVADVIEPEVNYENAVEVVLGDALQYIITENYDTVFDSIQFLKDQQAGRSGFMIPDMVKSLSADVSVKMDPEKSLIKHVRVKPGFEKLAESILGNVIIAPDLDQAISEWKSNGFEKKVVTGNGDLISEKGIILGGSQDKNSGILSKKNEIKQLEKQLDEFETEYNLASEVLTRLEQEQKQLEEELQKQSVRKSKATQDEIEAEKSLYKASEDVKQAKRHLEIVGLEYEQLLGEESDIDDELSKYNRALKEIGDEVENARQTVEKTAAEFSRTSKKAESYNQKIVELKLTINTYTAKLENSQQTLKRLTEFKADGIARLEQLGSDIERKLDKKQESEQRIQTLAQDLDALYQTIKSLEKDLEIDETDFFQIESQLKESDEAINRIQDEREKISEKIRYLELEQSHRNIKRENIVQKMSERYQSTIEDLMTKYSSDNLQVTEDTTDTGDEKSMSVEKMESEIAKLKESLAKLGDVNLGAIKEFEQLQERYDFLTSQRDDLLKAIEDLKKVVKKINRISQEKFMQTFTEVNAKLGEVFPRLFEGGSAKLVLTEPENPLESGVEFMVHPPGKKLTRMSLLSGGEKALSAIAFIFSIFFLKPASFCLMDEIDAPLDEANIFRFNNLLKMVGEKSQVIMVTHNKRSMEFSDMLFGVTMEKKGVSKIVSVNMETVARN